jgi:hypothetical protein
MRQRMHQTRMASYMLLNVMYVWLCMYKRKHVCMYGMYGKYVCIMYVACM